MSRLDSVMRHCWLQKHEQAKDVIFILAELPRRKLHFPPEPSADPLSLIAYSLHQPYCLLCGDTQASFLLTLFPGYAMRASQVCSGTVTIHHMRHTHLSALIDAGVPIATVAERGGYRHPATLLKVYTHAYAGESAPWPPMWPNGLLYLR